MLNRQTIEQTDSAKGTSDKGIGGYTAFTTTTTIRSNAISTTATTHHTTPHHTATTHYTPPFTFTNPYTIKLLDIWLDCICCHHPHPFPFVRQRALYVGAVLGVCVKGGAVLVKFVLSVGKSIFDPPYLKKSDESPEHATSRQHTRGSLLPNREDTDGARRPPPVEGELTKAKWKSHQMSRRCVINGTSMRHQWHVDASSISRRCVIDFTSMRHQYHSRTRVK